MLGSPAAFRQSLMVVLERLRPQFFPNTAPALLPDSVTDRTATLILRMGAFQVAGPIAQEDMLTLAVQNAFRCFAVAIQGEGVPGTFSTFWMTHCKPFALERDIRIEVRLLAAQNGRLVLKSKLWSSRDQSNLLLLADAEYL